MTKETEEFIGLLTGERAKELADYIVSIFGKKGEEPNPVKLLDYDFHVNRGVMLNADAKVANTAFSFDFPKDHFGKRIIELLGDEAVDAELTKETFLGFLDGVKRGIQEHPSFPEKIVKVVLGDGPPVMAFEVKSVILMDLPPIDWTVTVHKHVVKGSQPVPVAGDIMDEYLKTGDDLDKILYRKKKSKDPRYEHVDAIEKSKNFFECDIILWVDYSVR